MQECSRCKIKIHGHKEVCPLCGGPLTGEPEQDVYPIVHKKVARLKLVRFAAFLLVAFIISLVAFRFMVGEWFSWVPLAFISAGVAFLDVCVTMYYRTNPVKMIMWQAYLGMIICLLVDGFTGWYAWSVIWVLPCAFTGTMIADMAVGYGRHMMLQDVILYLLFDAVASLLQAIPIKIGANPFTLPAIISMWANVILLLAVLFFRWKDFKSASSRYFNI